MYKTLDQGHNIDEPLDATPDSEAVRTELDKILTCRTFRSAEGQRGFLRYIVEEALAGRGGLIKEYMIGMEALGRGESFDPRMDPIVRTQARKLRARLAKYYESEGLEDPLRIEFPKGSYVPSFHLANESTPIVAAPAGAPDEAITLPPASLSAEHRVPRRWKLPRHWKIASAGLALATISFALYVVRSRHSPPLADNRSIAVMPFANLGGNQDDDFLSDGITEELIDSLAQVPGLQVVARTSAFRFKGKAADIREIGQKLNVRTVLEGTVRRSDDRLRITVQLNSVPDGYHLWSGSYDRDPSDTRAIQWEISRAVTNALGVHLAGQNELAGTFPRAALPNPGAYQNYLKGRYHWNKLNIESLKTAIDYFERAIAEDPSFARAYTALADSHVMAPQVATSRSPEVVSKIRAAATKALELDPALGEAHFDLAICAEYEFDWQAAEREFKKGLELSPGNAVGHLWYAKFLALTGRKDEVLTQRRIAAELDPVSPYALQAIGGYYSVEGRYDEAIDVFRSALALEPNFGLTHQGLGVAYVLKGMPAEGIAELQKANTLMTGPRRMALLGYAYGLSGDTAAARRILSDFLRPSRPEAPPAIAVALIYLGLGDRDRAFEWLDKAVDQRDLDVTLLWDSFYQPLRSDPRYLALLRRMKLA